MPMLIDVAELAGLALEGCLYGIFLTLSTLAVYGYMRARAKTSKGLSSHTWPMALAGGLLVILCTARFAIDTANVFEAFIKHEDRTSRIAYLEDVRAPLFTTKHSLLVGVLFVGDSFVNWRCWVVWGKSIWVVIVPIILSITSAVSGSYTMWAYAHLPSQQIFSESHWLTAFYVLSLVANAMSTSLLAWRIYAARKEMREIQPSTYTNEEGARNSHPGRMSLKPILHIILESGALNAAYLFVYTMTLVTGTEGLEVMSEMACPLTGIVFIIVIIRVGLYSKPDAYWPSPRFTVTTNMVSSGTRTAANAESGLAFVSRAKTENFANSFSDVGHTVVHPGKTDIELYNFREAETVSNFGDKSAPLY